MATKLDILDLLPRNSWSPASRDAEKELLATKRRLGNELPDDLAELHRRCRKVSLLKDRYRFLAPDAIRPIAELQLGDETEDCAPRTWVGVVDLWDGNYVGVDLVANADGSHNWLDCDHEDVGNASVIGTSLEEFVCKALERPDGFYWLEAGHPPWEKVHHGPPPTYWRCSHQSWFDSLGEERGPEHCATLGCDRLRIALAVSCRKHHYEMIQRMPCPFDE